MPNTALEAIQAWGPRCYFCGGLATFRSPPILGEGLIEVVFTNGTLRRTEIVVGDEAAIPGFVMDRAQHWSRELNALGLPYAVTHWRVPLVSRRWYYCEEHRHGESIALHYRELLPEVSTKEPVEKERPDYQTRYERILREVDERVLDRGKGTGMEPSVRHLNEMRESWKPPIVCTDDEYQQALREVKEGGISIIEYRKIVFGKRWEEAYGV